MCPWQVDTDEAEVPQSRNIVCETYDWFLECSLDKVINVVVVLEERMIKLKYFQVGSSTACTA